MTELPCACLAINVHAEGAVKAIGLFWVAVLIRDPHAPACTNRVVCLADCWSKTDLSASGRNPACGRSRFRGGATGGFTQPKICYYSLNYSLSVYDGNNQVIVAFKTLFEIIEITGLVFNESVNEF